MLIRNTPRRAWLLLRMVAIQIRITWGCWWHGTTRGELRRIIRLRELTGQDPPRPNA